MTLLTAVVTAGCAAPSAASSTASAWRQPARQAGRGQAGSDRRVHMYVYVRVCCLARSDTCNATAVSQQGRDGQTLDDCNKTAAHALRIQQSVQCNVGVRPVCRDRAWRHAVSASARRPCCFSARPRLLSVMPVVWWLGPRTRCLMAKASRYACVAVRMQYNKHVCTHPYGRRVGGGGHMEADTGRGARHSSSSGADRLMFLKWDGTGQQCRQVCTVGQGQPRPWRKQQGGEATTVRPGLPLAHLLRGCVLALPRQRCPDVVQRLRHLPHASCCASSWRGQGGARAGGQGD